jgi:hypothetical protein
MNATSITTSAQSATYSESVSYLNRLIGFTGVFLNLFSLIIMSNKTLLHPLYNFFFCRQFCSLIVCALGCGWVDPLEFDVRRPSTYSRKFYAYFIFAIPFRLALTSSAISDLILILNRYCIVTDRKVFLINISKLANLTFCFAFPLCLYVPYFFMYELQSTYKTEYVLELTGFGKSPGFQIYLVASGLLDIIISVFALGFFNILSVIYFRKQMIRKGHLLKNRTTTKRAEVTHTKMIFILSTICLITRSIDTSVGILTRLMTLKKFEYSADFESMIKFLYELSSLMIFMAHALDFLVYFVMDRNLRRCVKYLFQTERRVVSL